MRDALTRGATVVTANNRLARYLHRDFNLARAAGGLTAWATPDILPWNAWLDRLWRESLLAGGVAGSNALLNEQQSRFTWERVIREQTRGDPFLSRQSVARLAQRAWRSCCDWAISEQTLQEAATSHDSRQFALWAGRYRRYCLAQRWTDLGLLPELLGDDLRSGLLKPPAELLFAGFDVWPLQRQQFAEQFEAAGSRVVCLPVHDDVDIAAPEHATSTVFSDEQQELEAAARWARYQLENDANGTVAVVIPDLAQRAAQVRRTFLNVLEPGWQSPLAFAAPMAFARSAVPPVNISYGWPLYDSGLVHGALLALKLAVGRMDYRELGVLLRSRYLGGGSDERSGRARLDIWLRRRIGTEIELATITARAHEWAPVFAGIVERAAALDQDTSGRMVPGQWVSRVGDFLVAAGWPGDAPLSSTEYQASEAWHRLLVSFAACDQVLGSISLRQVIDILTGMAREQLFQPEGPDGGIQVLGMLEAIGQQFEAVWVCGMTSDAWPPVARPDPLIPLGLQRRLGMPDACEEDTRSRAIARLSGILSGATEARISWVQWHEDEQRDPSPVVERLPARDRKLLPASTTGPWRERMSGSCRLELLPVAADAAPGLTGAEHARGGASLLAHQAACPARAFVQWRLGAEEIEVPAIGINAAVRGMIVHRALERLFGLTGSPLAIAQMDEGQRRQQLEEVIAETLASYLPLGQPFIARLAQFERERLVPLLEQLLAYERERTPFEVIAREQSCQVTVGPLTLRLRLDRIDRLNNGAELVLDYKTGQFSLAGWNGPRLADPQLPLYATTSEAQGVAIMQINDSGIRVLGVGAEDLDVAGIKAVQKAFPNGPADWPALVDYWHRCLQTVATEFVAGDFRIDRRNRSLAEGPYTMLTRIRDLDEGVTGAVDDTGS